MITHEEVRDNVVKIIDVMSIENCKLIKNEFLNIDKYINEQEKKDELLKLYRKYSKGLSSGRLNLQQLLDLFDKIKALEEALK